MIKAFIFDLDGVIVDTAKLHYAAWKKLANSLGFEFTIEANEQLKGVSRKESLDIVLKIGNLDLPTYKKEILAKQKNEWYIELVNQITPDDILPGAKKLINRARLKGYKTAIGSASKNTNIILHKLQLFDLFDAVVDGNLVTKTKPNPEVFLHAANYLNSEPNQCVVFEDSLAGIQAAINAGMYCIGVGDENTLFIANKVIKSLEKLDIEYFDRM